ncbi:unnamed protein product [Caenorhabditis auriculariae]|uniref:MARVEL domain-containing protein n=1 Tax=Caenorhabditis auriculariae TaxID=2777116 RepID=A0A8S1H9Y6_9PELO|nr:unnamed protein product [Caenorhabditis auriculariae]
MAPNLNISAFKYPLGFIRIVEFIFIVIAIAAVNSWGVDVSYNCPPKLPQNNTRLLIQKSATFTLSKAQFHSCLDDNSRLTLWPSDDSAGGSAGFFYFVNVAALIYVLIITFAYVILWQHYQSDKRFPFGGSRIDGPLFPNTIGSATADEHLTGLFKQEQWAAQNATFVSRDVNNGKLAISVLADWVCVLCFALNCWFIWKEVVPRDSSDPTTIA